MNQKVFISRTIFIMGVCIISYYVVIYIRGYEYEHISPLILAIMAVILSSSDKVLDRVLNIKRKTLFIGAFVAVLFILISYEAAIFDELGSGDSFYVLGYPIYTKQYEVNALPSTSLPRKYRGGLIPVDGLGPLFPDDPIAEIQALHLEMNGDPNREADDAEIQALSKKLGLSEDRVRLRLLAAGLSVKAKRNSQKDK